MKLVQLKAMMDHAKEDKKTFNVDQKIFVELVVLLNNMVENVLDYLNSLMLLSLNTVLSIMMYTK